MNKKLIGILCMVLIVSLPISFAIQSSSVVRGSAGVGDEAVFVSSAFDNDGDGVCNEPRTYYTEQGIDTRYADCVFTTRGDLCEGTPVIETAYRDADRSGCSDSQLLGYHNYWSINLGEMRPRTVKPNWLTDQRQGIRVYQPITIVQNMEYLSAEESVEFRDISLQCDNGRGVVLAESLEKFGDVSDFDISSDQGSTSDAISVSTERDGVYYVSGNYGRISESDLDSSDQNVDLEIFLNQQDEDLVRPRELIEGFGDVDLLQNLAEDWGINEIEFNCKVTIHQCREQYEDTDEGRKVKGCSTIYPPEIDEITIIVPLDTVAIRAPDEALDLGIQTADYVIDKTEWAIPYLTKAFNAVNSVCWSAVGIVLMGKIFSFAIPGLNSVADFIWFGPGKGKDWQHGFFYKGSFLVSGRSACAATVCPREWCGLLDWHPPGSEETLGDLAVRINPKTNEKEQVPIQSSLVLSSVCGCVSGLLSRMYYLRAIAMNWKICLLQARNSGEWVGECDRYLKEGICTFALEELQSLSNINLLGFLMPSGESEKGKADAATEATLANSLRRNAAAARGKTSKFYEDELSVIGRSSAGATMGYTDNLLFHTLCSFSLYRELPDFNTFFAHDIDRVTMESTRSGNYDYKVAYLGEGGKPVYSYRISWMVVAGKENMRYKVYLENDLGTKRQLHEDVLQNIGDFASDFVEITDDLEYTKICFEIPKESRRIVCFPPGGGSEGGLVEEINLFREGEIVDRDNDRLPDAWEIRWSCDASRTDFVETTDREHCNELLSNEKTNLLNPDSADSDGDGVNDGSEDPDGDGYNNYQEYLTNGYPNKAGETIDGGTIQSKCRAEFDRDNMKIKGGDDIRGITSVEKKFVPGQSVSIGLNGLEVLEQSTAPAEDILVSTMITGPDLFLVGPSEVTFNDALGGTEFVVWNIPSGRGSPSTGIYEVTVQLLVPNLLSGGDVCRDERNVLTEATKRILIYNSERGGCMDGDEGANYNIGSVCVDQTDVHIDGCIGNAAATDFFCRNGRCEAEIRDCGNGGSCNNGGCSVTCFDDDTLNLFGTPGICKDEIDVYEDDCNQAGDRIVEYYCGPSGTCIHDPAEPCPSGTECVTDNFIKTFPAAGINRENFEIAVCGNS